LSIAIETYFPTNFIQTFGTGANQPILTRAVSLEGVKDDIVIKLMSSNRMSNYAALK